MSDDSERRNGVPPPAVPEGIPGVTGADGGINAPESPLNAFKEQVVKRTPVWVKKGEKPKGRPSKAQIRAEKKLKAKTAKNPKNWGGRRVNAGRKVTGTAKKQTMVRMDRDLAEKLESLPQGKRSEYVRQALDLMKDIQPPEKFLASGK